MYYLLPYVLMVLHSVYSVLLLLILYSVLLMYTIIIVSIAVGRDFDIFAVGVVSLGHILRACA
jgi:hypothetical protein